MLVPTTYPVLKSCGWGSVDVCLLFIQCITSFIMRHTVGRDSLTEGGKCCLPWALRFTPKFLKEEALTKSTALFSWTSPNLSELMILSSYYQPLFCKELYLNNILITKIWDQFCTFSNNMPLNSTHPVIWFNAMIGYHFSPSHALPLSSTLIILYHR